MVDKILDIQGNLAYNLQQEARNMGRIKTYQKQTKQHKGKNAPARERARREARKQGGKK